MSRHLAVLLVALSLVAGCSRNPERPGAASPTAPSAAAAGSLLGPTSVAPGGISGKFDVSFPPRNDSFDFRRQLEAKYQQFGRGFSQSAVDAEGGVIWTQEYLRYRVNQCDHPTSVQKVFSQIDGGGVAPTCFVPPCVFTISPSTQNVPAAGGTFTATITRSSGDNCTFGAESLS